MYAKKGPCAVLSTAKTTNDLRVSDMTPHPPRYWALPLGLAVTSCVTAHLCCNMQGRHPPTRHPPTSGTTSSLSTRADESQHEQVARRHWIESMYKKHVLLLIHAFENLPRHLNELKAQICQWDFFRGKGGLGVEGVGGCRVMDSTALLFLSDRTNYIRTGGEGTKPSHSQRQSSKIHHNNGLWFMHFRWEHQIGVSDNGDTVPGVYTLSRRADMCENGH